MALETYLLLVCASRHRLFLSSFATAHRERAIPDVDLGASANPPTGFRGQLLACRLPFDPQAVHKNLVHGFGDQIAKRSRFGILNGQFPAPVVRRHLGRVFSIRPVEVKHYRAFCASSMFVATRGSALLFGMSRSGSPSMGSGEWGGTIWFAF